MEMGGNEDFSPVGKSYSQSKSMDARLTAVGAPRPGEADAATDKKPRAKRARRFMVEVRYKGIGKRWYTMHGYRSLNDARAHVEKGEGKLSALWTKYRVRRTDLKVVA